MDERIMETSKQYLNQYMNVDYYFERHIPVEDIHIRKPDLIISNYDLSPRTPFPCQWIRINHIPHLRDWQMLKHSLDLITHHHIEETSLAWYDLFK